MEFMKENRLHVPLIWTFVIIHSLRSQVIETDVEMLCLFRARQLIQVLKPFDFTRNYLWNNGDHEKLNSM